MMTMMTMMTPTTNAGIAAAVTADAGMGAVAVFVGTWSKRGSVRARGPVSSTGFGAFDCGTWIYWCGC